MIYLVVLRDAPNGGLRIVGDPTEEFHDALIARDAAGDAAKVDPHDAFVVAFEDTNDADTFQSAWS